MRHASANEFDAFAALGRDGGSYVVLCHASEDVDFGVIQLGLGRSIMDAQRRADQINATGFVELAADERQIADDEAMSLLTTMRG